MKITIDSIKKTALLAGGLFLSVLSVNADDVQDKLNLDYFKSPEAAAFKKYGEESVNEYTGTADISVPLYTIKCKDIEIPLVLRYDASGIKVEQEASWVGLGWNLMVGGCINYVCAGSLDRYGYREDVSNKVWTEYLTSVFGDWTTNNGVLGVINGNKMTASAIRSQLLYYDYTSNDKSNWMNTIPYDKSFATYLDEFVTNVPTYVDLTKMQGGVAQYVGTVREQAGMGDYVDAGFGERDFYSVNVLGKSFKFFIDPFTLNAYNIGQAGENFKVETVPSLTKRGIGNKVEITQWKITDSNGYVYLFEPSEKLADTEKSWYFYTSCWYLSEIKTPHGEIIKFTYTKHTHRSRKARTESLSLPVAHMPCCNNAYSGGYNYSWQSVDVTSHYLSKIETSNQTVTFTTTDSKECSGKRLDAITVKSKNGNAVIKTIRFSYGSFGYDNKGGNIAPAQNATEELRLKLNNVKEIASSDTLTTSFSYNSLNLPSKRSCAQDFWGYYNGQENKVGERGYSLIAAPQKFMTLNYTQTLSKYNIAGADRFSRSKYMQAAMLTKVVYPTGGYTTYEYEPNSIPSDFTLTEKYIDKKYDESYNASFSWDNRNGASQGNQAVTFELKEKTTFDIYLRCQGDLINNKKMKLQLQKWLSDTKLESERYFEVTCMCSTGFTLMNSKELQDLQELSEGKYTLRIIPPSASGSSSSSSNQTVGWGVVCQLKGWHKSTLSNNGYAMTIGGLRVKKISNFDNDNKPINYTTYNYNDDKGKTSGILLNRIETIDYTSYSNMTSGLTPGVHSVVVYTMNTGHSRMPTFYASCTPGIVGYSRVTKSKFNANGSLEKSVITSYENNGPTNLYGIDYYEHLDDGHIKSQDIYDKTGKIISKIENKYIRTRIHYATNLVATASCINANGPRGYNGAVKVLRYPYILSRSELDKNITTEYCKDGKTVITTKKYSYNDKNHQASQIDEYRSKNEKDAQDGISLTNQIQRTRIKYSVDDDKCKVMVNSYHRLNDVVETKKILVENGKENCVSTQRTAYNGGPYSLPISSSISMGNASLENRAQYTYDGDFNVRSVTIDGKETVYIWSYNSQYPIAKIEGLTFETVRNSIGQIENSQYSSQMSIGDKGMKAIDEMTRETDTNKIKTFITTLRTKVNELGGYITTYTYKPLVGMLSETQPNGNTVYYEYDAFGRLKNVKDNNKKTVKSYEYNYKK